MPCVIHLAMDGLSIYHFSQFSWGDYLYYIVPRCTKVVWASMFRSSFSVRCYYLTFFTPLVGLSAHFWCPRDLLINFSDKNYSGDNRLNDL